MYSVARDSDSGKTNPKVPFQFDISFSFLSWVEV